MEIQEGFTVKTMNINFKELQAIYKAQMDELLASTGLTTKCLLNYGTTKTNICPNCIYDTNLKKSSGKYKVGGPRPFVSGRICPYCNGSGSYGEVASEEVYLAVIANHKDWIIKPINVENAEGMIQTICSRDLYAKFKKCKDLTVVYSEVNSNPMFELAQDPTPAGLGDNIYIVSNWKRVGASSVPTVMVT